MESQNLKKWTGNIEVTAVEIDPKIAKVYQDQNPNDTVIIGDAHEYLLKHFSEFDFIWLTVSNDFGRHFFNQNKFFV